MARKQRVEEEEATIDMTPMLDIVFIMLIFFIVTTSFVKQAGVEVIKPAAKTAIKEKSANIFVAVTDGGDVWLDRRKVDVDRVSTNIERLLAEQPTDRVIVQADADADHGVVVKVMDQIKAAGINRIIISAQDV
ncbi:biopolymer transporter ExbD [Alteromonadaceae bacterium M269]|nr:biopolymer transporter ExbD [Alteromonadaceae bacterium M269]